MIDISNCYEAIGPLRASSDLGFHTFAGCDQASKFRGKSKSTWWKSFMETSSKTLNALSLLSSSESLPTLDVLQELESFVVQTYTGDKSPEQINTIQNFFFSVYVLNIVKSDVAYNIVVIV